MLAFAELDSGAVVAGSAAAPSVLSSAEGAIVSAPLPCTVRQDDRLSRPQICSSRVCTSRCHPDSGRLGVSYMSAQPLPCAASADPRVVSDVLPLLRPRSASDLSNHALRLHDSKDSRDAIEPDSSPCKFSTAICHRFLRRGACSNPGLVAEQHLRWGCVRLRQHHVVDRSSITVHSHF